MESKELSEEDKKKLDIVKECLLVDFSKCCQSDEIKLQHFIDYADNLDQIEGKEHELVQSVYSKREEFTIKVSKEISKKSLILLWIASSELIVAFEPLNEEKIATHVKKVFELAEKEGVTQVMTTKNKFILKFLMIVQMFVKDVVKNIKDDNKQKSIEEIYNRVENLMKRFNIEGMYVNKLCI